MDPSWAMSIEKQLKSRRVPQTLGPRCNTPNLSQAYPHIPRIKMKHCGLVRKQQVYPGDFMTFCQSASWSLNLFKRIHILTKFTD